MSEDLGSDVTSILYQNSNYLLASEDRIESVGFYAH